MREDERLEGYRGAPRFFVEPACLDERGPGEAGAGGAARGVATLTGDEAHHAARVLRLRPGDPVVLLDGTGDEALGEVVGVSPQGEARVDVIVQHRRRSPAEPAVAVHLVQACPKGDKMDLVLQKGTELGVSRFWPVYTERVLVSYQGEKGGRRVERWQRIVQEAAKQSRRGILPPVHEPEPLERVARRLKDDGLDLLILWEKATRSLRSALRSIGAPERGIALIVGPEGGLADSEVASLEALGAAAVSLGPRTLRTETAGPVATALVLYELEMSAS